MEHFQRGRLQLVFNAVKRIVDDAFGDGFLAIDHQVVHELGQNQIAILGVGQNFALFGGVTTGHLVFLLLRTLGAVLRTTLLTVFDALGIQNTAQDVVTDTGKVFYPAATDQNHRVLLKVVAFTRDVADDLETIGQAHFGNLPHGRVRLLRCRCINARANTTLLRASLKVQRLGAFYFGLPRFADQLLDRWHWARLPRVATLICFDPRVSPAILNSGARMPRLVVASSCVHDNAVNRSAPNLRGHAVGIQRIGTIQSGS